MEHNYLNQDSKLTSTENFHFIVTPTNRIGVDIKLLIFRDRQTVLGPEGICTLNFPEASAISIAELMELPVKFRIFNDEELQLESTDYPILKTIVGYQNNEVIVEICVLHPYDEKFFGNESPNEQYLTLMKKEVAKDSRFELDTSDEDLTRGAVEAMKSRGINMLFDPEPVTFTLNMMAETVGELSSALDKIIDDLEQKVKLKYKNQ